MPVRQAGGSPEPSSRPGFSQPGSSTRAPLLVHGIEWFAAAGAAVLANRVDDTLSEVQNR
ncbi:hypothetical protein [Streptomyces sp. NPDC004592]